MTTVVQPSASVAAWASLNGGLVRFLRQPQGNRLLAKLKHLLHSPPLCCGVSIRLNECESWVGCSHRSQLTLSLFAAC